MSRVLKLKHEIKRRNHFMRNYVCLVLTYNDMIFCCRSISNPDFWEFPHSEKEHNLLGNSKIVSLKEEIISDFSLAFGIYYPNVEKACTRMSAELSFANDKNIVLAHERECKWITKDDITSINWDPVFLPIANKVSDMLSKQQYRITELNTNGSEEIMWEDCCSEIQMNKEFRRIIHEQRIVYEEGKTKWRQIRVYNEASELIATES